MTTIVTLLGKVSKTPSSSSRDINSGDGAAEPTTTVWLGAWAFGTADPVSASSGGTTGGGGGTALPFAYTLDRIVQANETPIPSLQPENEELDDDIIHNSAIVAEGEVATTTPSSAASASAATSTTAEVAETVTPTPKDSAKDTSTVASTPATEKTSENTDQTIKSTDTTGTTTAGVTKSPPATTKLEQKIPHNDAENKAVGARAVKPSPTQEPISKATTNSTESTTTAAHSASSTPPPASTTNSIQRPKGPTFGDDGFVDACTVYTDCPPSGRWKGSFQAVAMSGAHRKAGPSKIPEYFDLFLYQTPPADATLHFPVDEEKETEKIAVPMTHKETKMEDTDPTNPLTAASASNASILPSEHHVYVRGAGANQFGIFELLGTYDRSTQQLRLQRLYVRFPTPKKRGRKPKPESSATSGSTRSTTRKRQYSWKFKASLETAVAPNSSSTSTTAAASGAGGTTGATSRSLPVSNSSAAAGDSGMVTPRRASTTSSVDNANKSATTSNPRPTKRPRTSQSGSTSGSNAAVKSPQYGAAIIRLPAEGEPQLARWRQAHLFHYLSVPKEAGGGGSTPTSTASSVIAEPKSVVYEGELWQNQRDGRGTCVYHNDMMYQGEWVRDKEHGLGTLWSTAEGNGTKKRMVYQGAWEKGRMHGQGTYYYYDNEGQRPTRYQGEFRENLRHGTGIYELPDGSTYNGQWQNGCMNGRGVFTWPDGSVYDGEWKDNRRHGNGQLKASDGFFYEGSWVDNMIEGRGSAVYPDGQEYHGMFSRGRRDGRGTVKFPNGAIYEGRFRDDAVDGQGTMKIRRAVLIPRQKTIKEEEEEKSDADAAAQVGKIPGDTETPEPSADFMIPISFQSDMGHIHRKAGFTLGGI